MRKGKFVVLIILTALFFTGCSSVNLGYEKDNTAIAKKPSTLDLGRGKLSIVPTYDKYKSGYLQLDLRSYDLTSIELNEKYSDLIHADFDTRTKWPYDLPDGFNPKKIIENGKNPGLNISELHKAGITGKGINIAIIDGALLVNHVEYEDKLKLYEEIHCLDKTATLDGCAVTSVVAGENTGVAPDANVYYIANTPGSYVKDQFNKDFSSLATSIDRVVEINEALPKENKIRALLIGCGWTQEDSGYADVVKAVEEAKSNGIFVISNSIYETYNHEMDFVGLGREPLSNPDEANSYGPGKEWESSFFMFERYTKAEEVLLAPQDSRCTASPTGRSEYTFYNVGDVKLSAAYITGLYALACQVSSEITPQDFWSKALETGDTINVKNSFINYDYKLKKVVNPVRLLEGFVE